MKILIDENMDESFPAMLEGHEGSHVTPLGWKGFKNGELLQAIADHGFEVLVTVDKQMRHQQNMARRNFAIVVLDIHPTSFPNQAACLPQLTRLLPHTKGGNVYVIEGPHPKRGA